MSNYDKTISMTHEEEGMYHRREVEHVPPRQSSSSKSYQVAKYDDKSSDDENFEEWTTSKRKVNHKSRQVETRVSRQLLVEDGKVIADSGPQVTTRIKEDNKVEECEKEKAPKHKDKFDALESAPLGESSGRVLGEKKEIQRVSREVREENMQYHDERFKELTGHDVHRRAIQSPHELITVTDQDASGPPRGKMVHYSNRGKKFRDTDEIREVAKLAIDGSITKEVSRKKHHSESSDDEVPAQKGDLDALRDGPKVERSSRKHVDYVNDFNDFDTPDCSEDEGPRGGRGSSSRPRHHSGKHDNQAFPKYEIDPLLNQLKDEDFRRPSRHDDHHRSTGNTRYVQHQLRDSSDNERVHHNQTHSRSQHRSQSPASHIALSTVEPAVEIPDEYKVNKNRIMKSKNMRPASPAQIGRSRYRQEDASIQVPHRRADDERSVKSTSSSAYSHQRTAKHLERQSTANSSRHYYYGDQENQKRHQTSKQTATKHHQRHRSPSPSSVSSASLSDPKEQLRRHGARSKDSGFRSPNRRVTETPSGQIYSVSNKNKTNRSGALSPTGSLGQRSVKTTTTTMSAGLTDRPGSRNRRASSPDNQHSNFKQTGRKSRDDSSKAKHHHHHHHKHLQRISRQRDQQTSSDDIDEYQQRALTKPHPQRIHQARPVAGAARPSARKQQPVDTYSLDNVSLASLGRNATTIKVPYRQVDKPQQSDETETETEVDTEFETTGEKQAKLKQPEAMAQTPTLGRNVKLQQEIESLHRRLSSISSQSMASYVAQDQRNKQNKEHHQYRTVVASVGSEPSKMPRQHYHQVIDAYNVNVIQHNSPFQENTTIKKDQKFGKATDQQQLSDLDTATTSGFCDDSTSIANSQAFNVDMKQHETAGNNNETNFKLSDFCRKPPRVVPDEDQLSVGSSCSLGSTRTYDVRPRDEAQVEQISTVQDMPAARAEPETLPDESQFEDVPLEKAEAEKISAWIFNPQDGSTTEIVPPPKPKEPESAKVEAEDLAQSKGGKSYYLSVQEDTKTRLRERPCSIDSLYNRWSSIGTLNSIKGSAKVARGPERVDVRKSQTIGSPAKKNVAATTDRKSRQMRPAAILDANGKPIKMVDKSNTSSCGSSMGFRSKSSSCLVVPSVKQTKYSIYGGLKREYDDKKPVPRLSYSRTIGPKSQRQINAQAKTPSRYLKMR